MKQTYEASFCIKGAEIFWSSIRYIALLGRLHELVHNRGV